MKIKKAAPDTRVWLFLIFKIKRGRTDAASLLKSGMIVVVGRIGGIITLLLNKVL